MRPIMVVAMYEGVEAPLLLQHVGGAGLVASVLSVRCIRSCRPFCSGWPGVMRSRLNAKAQPPDRQLAEAIERMGGREGHAVIGANRPWQTVILKGPLKHAKRVALFCRGPYAGIPRGTAGRIRCEVGAATWVNRRRSPGPQSVVERFVLLRNVHDRIPAKAQRVAHARDVRREPPSALDVPILFARSPRSRTRASHTKRT